MVAPARTLTESLAAHFHSGFHAHGQAGLLTPDVSRQAQRLVLDLLGVAVAGAKMPFPAAVRALVAAHGGTPQASVVGLAQRVPAAQAALANAAAGHALDMDDGYRYGGVHIGVAVIPAALAVAQAQGSSGRALLRALVAGYELESRLARAMNPSHLQRGFHTTGTLGPLGAALACGLLTGLDAGRLADALGLAALQSAGLLEVLHSGAMAKPLNPGKAAQAGVLAAELAARGAQGPRSALEGPNGLFRAMADGVDTEVLFDGLGTQPALILDQYVKLHAACRHIHPALDGLLGLMTEHRLQATDITAVDVDTYPVAVDFCGSADLPTTPEGAKFSFGLSLALAAHWGDALEHRYTAANVADGSVRHWAAQVRSQPSTRWADAYPRERGASLVLHTRDGRRLAFSQALAKGEPECPATDVDLHTKFRQNTAGQPPALQDRLVQAVQGLGQGDDAADVAVLAEALAQVHVWV